METLKDHEVMKIAQKLAGVGGRVCDCSAFTGWRIGRNVLDYPATVDRDGVVSYQGVRAVMIFCTHCARGQFFEIDPR